MALPSLVPCLVAMLLLLTAAPELGRAQTVGVDSGSTPQSSLAAISNVASQGLPAVAASSDPSQVSAPTLFAQARPVQGTIAYHYIENLYNGTKPAVADVSALPPCPFGGCGGCPSSAPSCTKINYNTQNPIMKHLNLIPVYYGTSWTTAQKNIIHNFLYGLGGSNWGRTTGTYGDIFSVIPNEQTSTSNAYFTGTSWSYSTNFLGTTLTDANIQTLADGVVNTAAGGGDPMAIYLVLTDVNIKLSSGFCTRYCGWHTYYNKNGKQIKYAFIGNALTQCKSACISSNLFSGSPNGDIGVDGMISVIAHEITEAATDPALNTWYDASGNENGDKCAWQFGTTANYNTCMSYGCFLIQKNWVRGGGCALTA